MEDPLFSLIQSLSQHEKRYLRLQFASGTSKPRGHLPRLYQLIAAQSVYDEAALKAKLADDPLGRQYAVHKNLLFQAILRHLQAYRYERSSGMQVRSGLDKIEILVEKGMHVAAHKVLQRTQQAAEDLAQHGYIQELLTWERRLLRYLHPLTYHEWLPRLEAYERKWMAILHQEAEAIGIYDRLFAWVQAERRMEKASMAPLLEAVGQRIATLEADVLEAFTTRMHLLNSKALYKQLLGDYEGMAATYGELLAHWDRHPRIKAAEPNRYARLQIIWLNSLLAAGKVEQHLAAIRALRKMPIQGSADQARIVFQSYNLELLWLMSGQDAGAALRFLAAFAQKLPEMQPYLDELRLHSLYLNAAMLCFRQCDYEQARAWAERIHGSDKPNRETHFYRNAAIVVLLCHFELGHLEATESQLAALGRRLGQHDPDWEFGKLVLHWLKRLLPKNGLPEYQALKAQFHTALRDFRQHAKPAPLILDLLLDWTNP